MAQLHFLREYARLYYLSVAGEYIDDGWSGTLGLVDRPHGRRLLEDARAGKFGAILVHRLNRLGRRLAVVIEAHNQLARAGVEIRWLVSPSTLRG